MNNAARNSLVAVLLGSAFLAGRLTAPTEAADLPLLSGEPAAERFRTLLRQPDANDRAAALADFFRSQVTAGDAETLRAVLDDERRVVDGVATTLLARWWARHDPVSALQAAPGALHEPSAPWSEAVIGEWARLDSGGAIRAIASEVPPAERLAVVRRFVVSYFDAGAPGGDAVLRDLFAALDGDVRARGEAIDLSLRAMIGRDESERAIAFAEGLPEVPSVDLRRETLGRLAGILSRTDPTRALSLIEQHAHGEYRLVLHRFLASQWAHHDGRAAFEWASGLPLDDDGREGTLLRAWRSWSRQDPEGASLWMRSQLPSPAIEPAHTRWIGGVARRDPEEALSLLDRVTQAEARRSILTNVAIALVRRDPVAGRAWMSEYGLSEEVRATVLDRVDKIESMLPRDS